MRKALVIFSFSVLFFSVILLGVSSLSRETAYYLNSGVCQAVRRSLGAVSSLFYFPLFEIIIILLPLFLIVIIGYVFRAKGKEVHRRFISLLSLPALIISSYILSVGIGYKSGERYEFDYSLDDYYNTAILIKDELNENYEAFAADFKIEEYYGKIQTYIAKILHGSVIKAEQAAIKNSIIPDFLSRVGIDSLFSFMTAEVIVNTEIPKSILPFTVSHELSHYYGVMSEGEANCTAFLSCKSSEDARLSFSADFVALEYILSDIARYDKKLSSSVLAELNLGVREQYEELFLYYNANKNTKIYDVANRLNEKHLELSDKNGKGSYSKLSSFAVSYYGSNRNSKQEYNGKKTIKEVRDGTACN